MWEDEHNVHGGRWLIALNKQQRAAELDKFWLELVSCLFLIKYIMFYIFYLVLECFYSVAS